MFNRPGIISQSRVIPPITPITPTSTLLYLRGDVLTDRSQSPKTIAGGTHTENTITFDTTDSIYGSNASMVCPSSTSSYQKWSARISGVSLGNAPWTMEMWIKRLGSDARMSVVTFLPPSPTGALYTFQPMLNAFGSDFSYWEHSGSTRTVSNVTQDSWVHLAICRQNDNTLRMFRNGAQFFSGSYTRDNTTFSQLYLGSKAYGTAVELARSSFKLAHFHLAATCYYTTNFTANKATGFS
jgi:hypothetical protein